MGSHHLRQNHLIVVEMLTQEAEFLALTRKYHDYLYGNKYIVDTDNDLITYIF